MKSCASFRRQLALLSVQALNEEEMLSALAHVKECDDCRLYLGRLRSIVRVYTEDAGRPIAPVAGQLAAASRPCGRRPSWAEIFVWPKPAFALLAVLAAGAALLIFRQAPGNHLATAPAATRSAPLVSPAVSTPTIGSSRHLAQKDLEALIEPAAPGTRRTVDFVYSVSTREEEL